MRKAREGDRSNDRIGSEVGSCSASAAPASAPDREKEFLDVLVATPTDADTRSVYADWLEDHGRTKKAEYLRRSDPLLTFDRVSNALDDIDFDFLEIELDEAASVKPKSAQDPLFGRLTYRWKAEDIETATGQIHVSLAKHGLRGKVESGEDEGTLTIEPATAEEPNDIGRLVAAFRALEKQGYYTDPGRAPMPSGGWEDANAADDPTRVVFWISQSQPAFDDFGDLEDSLVLCWKGDPKLICAALRAEGLHVRDTSSNEAIILVNGASRR